MDRPANRTTEQHRPARGTAVRRGRAQRRDWIAGGARRHRAGRPDRPQPWSHTAEHLRVGRRDARAILVPIFNLSVQMFGLLRDI